MFSLGSRDQCNLYICTSLSNPTAWLFSFAFYLLSPPRYSLLLCRYAPHACTLYSVPGLDKNTCAVELDWHFIDNTKIYCSFIHHRAWFGHFIEPLARLLLFYFLRNSWSPHSPDSVIAIGYRGTCFSKTGCLHSVLVCRCCGCCAAAVLLLTCLPTCLPDRRLGLPLLRHCCLVSRGWASQAIKRFSL